MNVSNMLAKLNTRISDIEQKYCGNCQEWDCDECPYEMEESDDD